MKIALILFAYNRPKYLKKAIKTHVIPAGIDTYAFVDNSDKQGEVVGIIDKSGLYDVIIPRREHYGLNKNIRDGIDWALLQHDAVIVLEDDLLLSDDAIIWLKYSLEIFYIFRGLTFSVSCHEGKPLDERFRCWAWGIWKDSWERIDWSVKPKEKNRDSWDVIVNEYMQQAKVYCYCSDKPRVKHIGAKGVHYNLIGYLKEKFL